MAEKLTGVVFVIIALLVGVAWTLGLAFLIWYRNQDVILQEWLFHWEKIEIGFISIPVLPLIALIWIPIYLLVILVAVIFGWVGISLIRTPAIEEIDIEELEKEIEEEAKRIEEEEAKKAESGAE